jgi:hypothetical protein
MKKSMTLSLLALLVTATMVLAVTDYSPQMYNARIYRVALGSGSAPSAAEAALVGIKNGDMVENTDDGVLYIMNATNVYTKITAAGALTVAGAVTQSGATTLANGSTIDGTSTNGTSRANVTIVPLAVTGRSGVSREVLINLGDLTGTTSFGLGSTNHSSYGVMGCFGRTAVAGSTWDGNYDTGVDFRCLNRMTNDAAYNLRGGFIKAKNYSGGVVGQMDGLTVECEDAGTTTESVVLKLGSSNSTVDYGIDTRDISGATADLILRNGALINNSSSSLLTITEATVAIAGALTATTMAPANGITTNVALLIGAGTTSTFYFVSGILTNIAAQ